MHVEGIKPMHVERMEPCAVSILCLVEMLQPPDGWRKCRPHEFRPVLCACSFTDRRCQSAVRDERSLSQYVTQKMLCAPQRQCSLGAMAKGLSYSFDHRWA